jgi:hypothetical protein
LPPIDTSQRQIYLILLRRTIRGITHGPRSDAYRIRLACPGGPDNGANPTWLEGRFSMQRKRSNKTDGGT